VHLVAEILAVGGGVLPDSSTVLTVKRGHIDDPKKANQNDQEQKFAHPGKIIRRSLQTINC
jgi:hypothetical protein